MNKRGLSAVVTTLMIILLALVAIGAIWVVVGNFVSQESEIFEAKSKAFYDQVNIKSVKIDSGDELSLIVSLQKLGGTSTLKGVEIITPPPSEIDIISVADLSGSMRACNDTSSSCCNNILNGNLYLQNVCYGIPSNKISDCSTQCSGILEDGLTPTQDANKELINILFEKENNNQLGLVAYSEVVLESFSSDLTNDNVALKNIIDSWEAEIFTCICCGINDAKNKLSSSPSDRLKTIIIMSDGEANRECAEQGTGDSKQDAINAACDAYNTLANLTIYSVGLGSSVDSDTLESIATGCGSGQNFSAYNLNELIDIYETLAEQIIKNYGSLNTFSFIKIVFYDESSNSTFRNVPPPDPLETTNYDFNLTDDNLTAPIVKVEIYPVIVTKSGKEIIGNLFYTWEK